MPRYTDLTPLFIFTSWGQPCKQEKCSSERPQPPALHLKWVRALDMLIWPLASILNLHQTHFIEHSKNPDNEWKLVTVLLAMIHLLDNIDIRVYKRLMMFYKDWMIQWCHWPGLMLQPGFDWHATRNWWPADGMGSRSDKMSRGHGTPVTKLLPRSWHEGAPCLTFSAETRRWVHGDFWLCVVKVRCKYSWLTQNPWQDWN